VAEQRERTSEALKGARRGAGWAFGFGAVLGAGAMMRNGPRPAFKGAMKGILRAREAGAEAVERLQDVYAEAESEHAAETLVQDG